MLSDRDFQYRYPWADLISTVTWSIAGVLIVSGLVDPLAAWSGLSVRDVSPVAVVIAVIFAYQAIREIRVRVLLQRNGSVQVTAAGITVVDAWARSASLRPDEVNVLVCRRPVIGRLGGHPGWRFRLYGASKDIPIYRYIEEPDGLEDAITTVAGLAAVEVRWWGRMYTRPITG